MFKRQGLLSRKGRGLAVATAAAMLVAGIAPTVQAAPIAKQDRVVNAQPVAATSDATDISARRYARRGYRGNNAAGLAFMGLALGTVGAVIANQQRRDYYRQNYAYGGNPYYGGSYYGGPAYYGGGGGYYGRPAPYYYGY